MKYVPIESLPLLVELTYVEFNTDVAVGLVVEVLHPTKLYPVFCQIL